MFIDYTLLNLTLQMLSKTYHRFLEEKKHIIEKRRETKANKSIVFSGTN